ncbi:NADH-FMN oxidoreductase RutF, flavin reductase (DIM6/NTAB) family [Halobacillus karajensis]|uniref:Flavin reductase like domain protein n=1 Tax=Halobacillus karajensis TaxID=195088 RepID=A0A024P956_9BACI|nr:flavin reductase family protein [Halobacillus karajensis]CDQ21443.1 Flavin reductase like domain protein [Halobacillus karajensis]CDQ25378.1 Flavin reductase like domain protein [Halobacillus karajensis]CDQ29702.1 Flavin reductase like domain protein [Halobacillus karajensis]SEI07680.1 NADH-FMN oxidoreductase RutF, flavin reductase (DIM6/NTAB) family [Halobacillus karajensis]
MLIGEKEFQNHTMSKLIKGAVVPRPIAWISTVSQEGIRNLAPFSFFTVASMEPITLCFSIGGAETDKDTLENVKQTGQFIINVVTETLANQMHTSSKVYPPEVDEFNMAGTEWEDGDFVNVPRVKESPVHMECELDRVIEIGEGHLVLGKLVGYHIQDEVYEEKDRVDPRQLKPVGRMAGNYSYIRDFFKLPNEDLPE